MKMGVSLEQNLSKGSKSKNTIKSEKSRVKKKTSSKQMGVKYITIEKWKNYKCTVCEARFDNTKNVIDHYRASHISSSFKCAECLTNFNDYQKYLLHLKVHVKQTFYCNDCNYKGNKKSNLQKHIIRYHLDEYHFQCSVCGKKYKLNEDFLRHIREHAVGQHVCDTCGHVYPTKNSLNKHRRKLHINVYKFRCPKCDCKLLSQENLDTHMEKYHKNPIICELCGAEFRKTHYLTLHTRRVHKNKKPYLCTICGKSFVTSVNLRNHCLTHTKSRPYICNVCGQSFTQRSSLMIHWKRQHPEADDPPPPVLLTKIFQQDPLSVQK